MESVVPLVAERLPSLPVLRITDWRGPTPAFLADLLLCRNLRSLTTGTSPLLPFSPAHIRTLLASLPSLTALNVQVEGFCAKQTPTTPIYAPNLRTLRCIGTCADLAKVGATLRAPALREVELGITDELAMTLSDLVECVQNATSTHFSSSLRRVSIAASMARRPSLHRERATQRPRASWASVLRPSPALLQLETFEFSLSPDLFAPSMTDDDALAVAQAMPRLRRLVIDSYYFKNIGIPSPHALLHFAKFCPDLEQLWLQGLEGTPIPDISALCLKAASPVRVHPLRSLRLVTFSSAVAAPDALAELLDYVFPHLTFQPPRRATGIMVLSSNSWQDTARQLVLLQRRRRDAVAASGSPALSET